LGGLLIAKFKFRLARFVRLLLPIDLSGFLSAIAPSRISSATV